MVDRFPSACCRQIVCASVDRNLDPVKGFDVLIRAGELCREKITNVIHDRVRTAHVIGENDAIARTERTMNLKDKVSVRWSDDTPRRFRFATLRAASRSESFGFVIAERLSPPRRVRCASETEVLTRSSPIPQWNTVPSAQPSVLRSRSPSFLRMRRDAADESVGRDH